MTTEFRKNKVYARENLQKIALCRETTLNIFKERIEIYEQCHEKNEKLKKEIYRKFLWRRLQDTEIDKSAISEAISAYKELYGVDNWLKKMYEKALEIRMDKIGTTKAKLDDIFER